MKHVVHSRNLLYSIDNIKKTTIIHSECLLTEVLYAIQTLLYTNTSATQHIQMYQQMSNSQPWYTSKCAVVNAYCNYYFHFYHQNQFSKTHACLRDVCNYCKILENAKISYALQSVQVRINKKFGESLRMLNVNNTLIHHPNRKQSNILLRDLASIRDIPNQGQGPCLLNL